MALTIGITATNAASLREYADVAAWVMGEITWDSSYPTNGEAIAIADFNTAINSALSSDVTYTAIAEMIIQNSADGTLLPVFDKSNGKIKALRSGSGFAITKTTETGITPAAHVHTPTLAPDLIISAAGTAVFTAAFNLQRNLAPVTTGDANVAADESTYTSLAADNAGSSQCTQLNYTAAVAGGTEFANTTDLSGAGKKCRYFALLTK